MLAKNHPLEKISLVISPINECGEVGDSRVTDKGQISSNVCTFLNCEHQNEGWHPSKLSFCEGSRDLLYASLMIQTRYETYKKDLNAI